MALKGYEKRSRTGPRHRSCFPVSSMMDSAWRGRTWLSPKDIPIPTRLLVRPDELAALCFTRVGTSGADTLLTGPAYTY